MRHKRPSNLKSENETRDLIAEIHEGIEQILAGAEVPTRVVEVSPAIHLRRKCGLSLDEIAAKLGVSASTYKRWELGRRQPTGAARVLLDLISSKPELVNELE